MKNPSPFFYQILKTVSIWYKKEEEVCDSVFVGCWFCQDTLVSFINKTVRYNITEIVL